MKNIFLLFSLLTLFSLLAIGQGRNCGTTTYEHHLKELDPDYEVKKRAIFEQAKKIGAQQRNGVVVTIPVVVHIVWNNQTQNISDAQIQSQIEVLNDDFRRMNSDASNTPSTFASLAQDSEIEFCLASVDPTGNSTTGITRTQTSTFSFSVPYSINDPEPIKSTASGGKDAWNSSQYLNMWVCNMSGGVLGYATFPGTATAAKDGVVIGYRFFGNTGVVSSPYNGGRTTTHEVGHYLGLPHIWGDGACSADDGIADTPVAGANYGGCPSHPQSSCGSVDMFMNYMDYVDDACMNMFTIGQSNVMRGTINGIRASLVNSAATVCGTVNPGQCTDLTQNNLTMGFETTDDFTNWKIEDANGDGNASTGSGLWRISPTPTTHTEWGPRTGDQFLVYSWNTSNAADDWVFTPCLSLLNGHTYSVSYWFAAAADDYGAYPEKLELGISTDQTSANVFQTLQPEFTINNVYPTYMESSFTVTAPNDIELSFGFHAVSDANQYALQLEDINISDITAVSNEDLVDDSFVKIYPNPATNILNLAIDADQIIEEAKIKVMDMTGRVLTERLVTNLQTEEFSFDISDYTNGVYLINFVADGQVITKKVVVAK